jgi:hypothetical protein
MEDTNKKAIPLPKGEKPIPYQLYKLDCGVYYMCGEEEYVGKLPDD